MGGAEVGDVEALDANRKRVHRKRLTKIVERVDALLAAPLSPKLVLLERELRVSLGQLVDPALVAAARMAHLDGAAAPLLEVRHARRGDKRRIYELAQRNAKLALEQDKLRPAAPPAARRRAQRPR